MSSSLVIVALPAEDDIVWKVSSEQKPHLTLMYLGEATEEKNLDRIAGFVEHALAMHEHGPFYLDVDFRGELGEDKADVLFFSGGWEAKWIKSLRGQLLQQSDIRAAFETEDQFPEWVPHLTLGYPDTPAHPIPEDRRIYSVSFDRIAVWMGDYEGPTFRLKWPERESELAVAYSDTGKNAVEELLHFGVKGMRWGQRKDTEVTVGGNTKMVTAKKAEKLDKAWEKNIYTLPGALAVHNAMADHFNQRIGALNDKYKDDDFSKENWDKPDSWSPAFKKYNDEVGALTLKGNALAVEKVHGTSPTGKRKAELSPDGDRIFVKEVKIAHAAGDTEVVAALKITRNSAGLIIKVEPLEMKEDSMSQASEIGAEFLEQTAIHGAAFAEGLIHYGIKGMRWGVRKEAPAAVAPQAASVVPHGSRRKTQIAVKGGENHPASDDAIKVAQARAKLVKSGPSALSNQELRDVATRMQLEAQVSQMTKPAAQKFVSRLLSQQGNQAANQFVQQEVRKGLAKRTVKTAARAAL